MVASLALSITARAPILAVEIVRVAAEFQVNTFTIGAQSLPDIAIDGDGDVVVVWTGNEQDGALTGVFGRRFNSSGSPLAGEFQVNVRTADFQSYGVAAANASGAFVVVWESEGQDGSGRGLFGRRFDTAGSPVAGEFQVNSYTSGYQGTPAVGIAADGDFVVAWNSAGQDGDVDGVFARRFSSTGVADGSEFQVNVHTESDQRLPALAMRSDGGFILVWHGYQQDGAGFGVFGRRFDADATPLAVEFQVSLTTVNFAFYAAIATDAQDDFVVVWETFVQDGDNRGVFGRRFASSGAGLGGEFQVNSFTPSAQRRPAIALEPDGDFVVVWSSLMQEGAHEGVFGQIFDSAGNRQGAEFHVNTFTASNQQDPRVVTDDGRFVVVWQSFLQDGQLYGVFAQRFADASALDVDLDGQVEALTDGLLILRRMFGFTDATLVTGAVDLANCQRCGAPAIAAYIDSISSQLDIDGDTEVEPLTDGLLVLRWMFGFTGATLITGAVDLGNCTRCTAPLIETYLQGLAG